jgi:hypothetical protein
MWPFRKKERDFREFRLGFDCGWSARDVHAKEQIKQIESTLAERGISLTTITPEQSGHFVATDSDIKH